MRGGKEVAAYFNVPFPEWSPQLEVLYEDTKGCLEKLREKYRIGVIANQNPGTNKRLRTFGILQYIDVVAASSDEGFNKPDERLFEVALQKANCRPDQAIMIGDRIDNDIVPAKRLGMKTIWIRQGLGRYWSIRRKDEMPD